MANGINIVNEFNDFYQEAYYAWNPFYPLADTDLRAYLGDQWENKEKQALFDAGRNSWVYNLIRKNINMIDGYQRSHRLSSIVLPQETKDQEAADELSDLLQYVYQAGDGYKFISDAFSGGIKTGWNLCTVWMDFREDPVNGDIKFGREPYSGFITDPYFTQLDLSDCSYVLRRKYMGPEMASSLLPGMEKEVWDIHQSGWSRDDKFTWLPYQTQPNGQDFMGYDEFHKQMWKKVPVLVDEDTGEYTEWTGPKDALRYMIDKHPQLKVVQQPKRFIETHVLLNNVYMKTEINQFGLDEYSFVPFVGVFEPENELWGLKLQSLTRCMLDPQRQCNRLLSQMTDIIESQINSGYIADEDSVINPRSLFQTSQGRVIWRDKNARPGAIEKIPAANIPPSFFQLTDIYAKGPSEILGINEASFGIPESGNESGIMMMLRQGAAINNQQGVMDNLRYAQKQLSKKVLKLIQTWTPEKVERILGRKPTAQFYSKDFIKYDISVQEGMLTDTQRQMHFRQMVDVYQLTGGPQGSPITPSMLVKAAPIQGSGQLQVQIAQNEKQAAQAQQQQMQVQQALLQGQMEAQKAAAVEKMAGAKERFTRSVANLGLEDERAARAIDDRASAALDRAKAMKELSTLDDDRLLKYLQIVRLMEEGNRQKEEQIKQDDVAISASGGQAAPPSAEQYLGEQGAPLGQQNPTNEVPNGQF